MSRNSKARKQRQKEKFEKIAKELPRGYTVNKPYIRLKVKYPIWFVLNNIGEWTLKIAGHDVKMWSQRYYTFKNNGIVCVGCGLKGEHFRLERHALGGRESFHFNLYANNGNGNEILMTKDHIVPKSKGGKNHITNLQTMCTNCNNRKDDS